MSVRRGGVQVSPTRAKRDQIREQLNERMSRPPPAVWLSGQQAAEHVGCSWESLKPWLLEHRVPHVRIGNLYKIEVAVLDEHLRRAAEAQVAP